MKTKEKITLKEIVGCIAIGLIIAAVTVLRIIF